MSVGANIRFLRELHNLTQIQLANIIGVSNKTISAWEAGRTEPNIEYINTMCTVFGCDSSDIINRPFVNQQLSKEQKEAINLLSRATPEQKDAFIELLRTLYS
jgi:transcriptional regulator with XRE-family HTH domain